MKKMVPAAVLAAYMSATGLVMHGNSPESLEFVPVSVGRCDGFDIIFSQESSPAMGKFVCEGLLDFEPALGHDAPTVIIGNPDQRWFAGQQFNYYKSEALTGLILT